MPFPIVPTDLQNLSTHHAQLAYQRMTKLEHSLQDTNPALWRELYNAECRRVMRGEQRPPTNTDQLSLPPQRQA